MEIKHFPSFWNLKEKYYGPFSLLRTSCLHQILVDMSERPTILYGLSGQVDMPVSLQTTVNIHCNPKLRAQSEK